MLKDVDLSPCSSERVGLAYISVAVLAAFTLAACSKDAAIEEPPSEGVSKAHEALASNAALPAALTTVAVVSTERPPSPPSPPPPTLDNRATPATTVTPPSAPAIAAIPGAPLCGGVDRPTSYGQLGCRQGDCYRNPGGDDICAEPPGATTTSSRVLFYCPSGTTTGTGLSDCRPVGGFMGGAGYPFKGFNVCCTAGTK